MPYIDTNIENKVHLLIADLFVDFGSIVLAVGGTSDHIHIVHSLPRTKSIAEILKAVKSVSSNALG